MLILFDIHTAVVYATCRAYLKHVQLLLRDANLQGDSELSHPHVLHSLQEKLRIEPIAETKVKSK
jgi:hypothetical protein